MNSTARIVTKWKLIGLTATLLIAAGCKGSERAPEAREAEEHHESGETHIELTPEQVKAAGISLERAGPATIRETLSAYGVVALNSERVRDVSARFPGMVQSVTKRMGDDVRRGEPLATIESNESLQTYTVVAPIDGVVAARAVNAGEQSGDKVLFTIADLSTVWIELAVFPRDASKVRVGQLVQVESSARDLRGTGRIVNVAPFGSNASQTLTARVQLDNPERRWTPGLHVNAAIALADDSVGVAVRSGALQSLSDQTVVFVSSGNGFEPRSVRTGRADREWVEITAGLAAGDTYAAANSFIVKAELGKGSAEHDH